MKKTKLIMPIVATATTAAAIAPAITLTGCSSSINAPELSTRTPKVKQVASNSERTYFLIEQKNINQPEATKVKLTNLVVNGASVTAVAGIIKSTNDSAGNILVTFNMSLVQTQYQAESIKFDLKLTNKKANTEYTLTGFEVNVDASACKVEYEAGNGVTVGFGPDSVNAGKDLNATFSIDDTTYEYTQDACDVKINGVSVKDQVTFDFANGTLKIPGSVIVEECTIQVIIATNLIVTDIEVTGTRNLDVDSTSEITYQAFNQLGREITDECTFSIINKDYPEDENKKLGTFNGNTLTLSDYAKNNGGSGKVLVKFNPTEKESDPFEVEVASFSKLNATNLASGQVFQNESAITSECTIITPSRYYVDDTTGWKDTTEISYNGLRRSSKITGVHISKNISTLYAESFASTLSLMTIDSLNSTFASPGEGSNCLVLKSDPSVLVRGCKGTDLTKATGITKIGDTAFKYSGIETVVIPSTITQIGTEAYSRCSALKSLSIQTSGTAGLKTIGKYAFYECPSLTSIVIPSTVETIAPGAFSNNPASTTITLPDSKWIQTGDSDKKLLNVSDPTTNAKRFRKGGTGYWATTGINVDPAAALSATVTYDTSWKTAGISIDKDSSTAQVIHGTTDKITIKNYAGQSADVSGKIVVTSASKGEIIRTDIETFATTQTTVDIDLDATAWTKIVAEDTLTVSFIVKKTITNFDETGLLPESIFQMDASSGGTTNFDPIFKQKGTNTTSVPLSGVFRFKDDIGLEYDTETISIPANGEFNISMDLTELFTKMTTRTETAVTITFVSDTKYAGLNYDALTDMTISNQTVAISNQDGHNTVSFDVKVNNADDEGLYKFIVKYNGTQVYKTTNNYEIESTATKHVEFTFDKWDSINGHELTIETDFQERAASVDYNGESFEDAGIELNEGCTGYISQHDDDTITIVGTAAAEVTGTITVTNKDAEEVIKLTGQTFKTTETTIKINIDAATWKKIAPSGTWGGTVTVSFTKDEESEKDKFGKAYDALIDKIDEATSIITTANIKSLTIKGSKKENIADIMKDTEGEHTGISIGYTEGVATNYEGASIFAQIDLTWESASSLFAEPGTGITYKIDESGAIEYEDTTSPTTGVVKLKVNSSGYIEEIVVNDSGSVLINTVIEYQ